jgi:hypothetical protein
MWSVGQRILSAMVRGTLPVRCNQCEPVSDDCEPRCSDVGLKYPLESMIVGSYANGIK